MKVIDGTKSKGTAPSPSRGLIKAVYYCVAELGGATYDQVRRYLPAAIDSASQIATPAKLERCLKNAVYRGYLIHDSTDHFRVAPIEYYEERQRYLQEVEARTVRDGVPKKKIRMPVQEFIYARPMWHWSVIVGVGLGGFMAGWFFGVMVLS